MPRLADGTRYPSVAEQPLSHEELKVWAYWAQYRPRALGQLAMTWPGGFSAWLRQHFAEAEHAAVTLLMNDATLTAAEARKRSRIHLLPPPETAAGPYSG